VIQNVFACLPRDTSGLPVVPGVLLPVPSADYTLKQCDKCDCDIWIGQHQLAMYREHCDMKLCFICAIAWLDTKDLDDVDIVLASLHPDDPTIPRT
jgi:hypothetical protein